MTTSEASPASPPAPIGRGRWPIAVAAVFALALIASFTTAVRRPRAGPEVGRPAPNFTLVTFDGPAIALDELRGKVVVVNFWASWCVPCADEADDLENVWQRFRNADVQFLGVDFVDTEGPARDYLARHAVTYPNGPDLGGRISQHYGVKGVPETFVVDRAGRIASVAPEGAAPKARLQLPLTPNAAFTPDDLAALIDRLLAQTALTGASQRPAAGRRP